MGNSINAGPMWHSCMYILNYTMLLCMLPMFFFCTWVYVYNFFDTNDVLCLLYVIYIYTMESDV